MLRSCHSFANRATRRQPMVWVRCAARSVRPLLPILRRDAAMPRFGLLLAAIITLVATAAGGCRSCSSCHDYDPPVANCNCDACGTHRSGSAFAGGCNGCSEGSNAGCSTCNGGNHDGGEYAEGEYLSEGSYATEGATNMPPSRPTKVRR